VKAMIGKTSPMTGKKYSTRMVLLVGEVPSSVWYTDRLKKGKKRKPGPNPTVNDVELLKEIKDEIKNSKFHSEGYKKIHKRLNRRGVYCGANRVYKMLVINNLLAPQRPKHNGSSRVHDGKIITQNLNKMWGTDGKYFYTEDDGQCWLFSVIDHCSLEILGWHVVKIGNRFAALEPVKQAVKKEYGCLDASVCRDVGLFLRSDHGSQYDSRDFQNELKFLGLLHSPAFVRSPECNGVIERFHRTISEQVFKINDFKNLEEAQNVIKEFIGNYNNDWLVHRLNLQSPVQFRHKYEKKKLLKCA